MVRRKKRKPVAAPALRALRDTPNADAQNRLLLAWLEDDRQRRELYALVNQGDGELTFPSRDSGQREDASHGLQTPRPPPVLGHAAVTLVTRRAAIDAMLRNKDTRYSSRVYTELGGGSFMLALDPKADDAGDAHCAQRKAYRRCFPDDERGIQQLAYAACQDASIMSLRAVEFDLASFAEQAALRFCQKLMGYSFGDHALLEATLRDAYAGLVYQVFGRHFTSDPLAMPKARQALARLVSRTSRLIDAYAANDADELKGRDQSALRFGVQPVLAALGADDAELNGEQRAIIAVGAAVGTVGNVQAAACIAVQHLFSDPGRFTAAQALACRYLADEPTESARWKELIEPALRADPPIPFLPRIEVNGQGKAVREFLLALGGGTQGADAPAPDTEDPLIWGLPDGSAHACAGRVLAWPLIAEIVRHVMRLPGIEQQLDPRGAEPIGLEKRWGFICERYPLTYQRERRAAQSSLNVAMRIRSPVKDYADRVRQVIRSGAPRIEEALRESRHVHFAWFELIESDTVLVLHTVYDGPFWAYIQHFALRVGDLFDALFECIENPPPMPVDEFPDDFVAHIQRYDRKPATGYFFSAYPNSDVARILRGELAPT